MVEVKCGDLIGPALDWAVAKAIGGYQGEYQFAENGGQWPAWIFPGGVPFKATSGKFAPSTNWAQGGPLISKHHMDFCCEHPETIGAALCDENGMYIDGRMIFGKTHLIAACRAIVAARLGEVVSVPAELISPAAK